MNLTKLCVAGLCLSAMTASAGFIKSNAFEVGEAGTGWYFHGTKDWDSEGIRVANDTTNNRASYSSEATNRPYASAANAQVLKLDTEGSVWTNVVDQSFSATVPVCADMLVKFVPSEELPSIALDVKMAVAIKQDVDTKFYLNLASIQGETNGWTKTAQEISTNDWNRLTIKLFTDTVNIGYSMVVYVNGVKVAGGTMAEGGFSIRDSGSEKLNSIGFQGTGYIDEVVVRDDDPFGGVKFAGTYAITDPQEYTDWLTLAGLDAGEETAAMYDAFLWNVKPDGTGSPLLKVGSIVIGETTVTLTVVANYPVDQIADATIDVGNLNNGAQATVYGEASLETATWTTPIDASEDLIFDPGLSNFYKVMIQ